LTVSLPRTPVELNILFGKEMARSIKLPLIFGGLVALASGPIGVGVIMGLADSPRKLAVWREGLANVIIWLTLLILPVYLASLVTAIVLRKKQRDGAAFRISLIPFFAPVLCALLIAVYFILPGVK
jgi:hypothetical protein